MLNRSISRDRDLSDLVNEHGSDVGLLFSWMIPHLDRDGRLDADPEVVKGLVVPRIRRINSGKVAELLRILSAKKLVEVYEDDRGLRFLSFPGFKKNQKGMRYDREAASEFPDPESCRQVSGLDPDQLRIDSGSTPAEWNRIEENGMEGEGEKKVTGSSQSLRADDQASIYTLNDIWQWYRRYHKRAAKKIGDKNAKLGRARLKEGFTPDDLKQAIDGYHRSPWHKGVNDRNTQYLGWDLIMRDQGHVQRGIEMATDPLLDSGMSEQTRKNVTNTQQWLEHRQEKRRQEEEQDDERH